MTCTEKLQRYHKDDRYTDPVICSFIQSDGKDTMFKFAVGHRVSAGFGFYLHYFKCKLSEGQAPSVEYMGICKTMYSVLANIELAPLLEGPIINGVLVKWGYYYLKLRNPSHFDLTHKDEMVHACVSNTLEAHIQQ